MGDNLLYSDIDHLSLVISKQDVLQMNTQTYVDILNNLITDRYIVNKFRNRVDIAFEGYDTDPREIFEVAEIRKFVRQLDDVWPYWFFFLTKDTSALMALPLCLCNFTKIGPGRTQIDPGCMYEFVTKHFHHSNLLFEKFNIPHDINATMTAEVIQYFRLG